MTPRVCDFDGCLKRVDSRGLCAGHDRQRRLGRPLVPLKSQARHGAPPAERFWARVNRTPGCWLWAGWIESNGYGRFSPRRATRVGAHRYAYELLVGPIPDGLTIDHLCGTRECVNPEHLEPVPIAENVRRAQPARPCEYCGQMVTPPNMARHIGARHGDSVPIGGAR